LESNVYNPSTMTMRCRARMGTGDGAGSFALWSNVGKGIGAGGVGSNGVRSAWMKLEYESRLKVNDAPCESQRILQNERKREEA
jgi:hypothetical protein